MGACRTLSLLTGCIACIHAEKFPNRFSLCAFTKYIFRTCGDRGRKKMMLNQKFNRIHVFCSLLKNNVSKNSTGHMVTFLWVLRWLGWTLPLRDWWEGMALWRKRLGAYIAAVIIWILYCWVCSFSPLHGWGNDLMVVPCNSIWLPKLSLNTNYHNLLTFFTQSRKTENTLQQQLHCLLTYCVWSMMLSRNTAGGHLWKSPVPSAQRCQIGLGLCGR